MDGMFLEVQWQRGHTLRCLLPRARGSHGISGWQQPSERIQKPPKVGSPVQDVFSVICHLRCIIPVGHGHQ